MDSQSATQLIQIFSYILIPILIAVFGLIGFLIYIFLKEKKKKKLMKKVNLSRTKQIQIFKIDNQYLNLWNLIK